MSGTAAVGNTFASAVTATGLQLDNNFSTVVAYLNDPTNRNNYAADGGTTNTVVPTFAPPVVGGYTAGLEITFKAAATNSGGVVVNANGLGNKSLVNPNGSGMQPGQIVAGAPHKAVYDGTQFVSITGWNPGWTITTYTTATQTITFSPTPTEVIIEGWGAGASGAGANSSDGQRGSGGGAGGYFFKQIKSGVDGTFTIAIGTGGTVVASTAGGANGVDGGATTVSGAQLGTLTAGGGVKGVPGASANGGDGGSSTGGDENITGQAGSVAPPAVNIGVGFGGSSPRGGPGGSSNVGAAGRAPGGGGSSGNNGGNSGAGANGAVKIWRR